MQCWPSVLAKSETSCAHCGVCLRASAALPQTQALPNKPSLQACQACSAVLSQLQHVATTAVSWLQSFHAYSQRFSQHYRNSRCHANTIVTTVLTLLPPHLAVLHSAGFAHSHLHCWQAYSRCTYCAATSTAWLKSLEVTEASHLECRARHSVRSKTQQG